jgi:hypothetical protein
MKLLTGHYSLSGIGGPELLLSNQVSTGLPHLRRISCRTSPAMDEVVEMQQFSEEKQSWQQLHP